MGNVQSYDANASIPDGNPKPGRRNIASMQVRLLLVLAPYALALWTAALTVGLSFGAEVKRAMINDAEISYVYEGTGEPIIFLHGAGTDMRIWEGIEPLVTTSHRLIAYSRRHQAPNRWPDDGRTHTIAQHVEDLAGFMRSLGLSRAHVVGVSLGGVVAARFAYDHPELVQSLVLNDALLARSTSEDSKAVMDAFWGRFDPFLTEVKAGHGAKAAQALVEWLYGEPDAWDRLPPTRKQIYLENANVLLLLPIDKTPRLTCTALGEIKAPTLVMGGDRTPAAFRLTNEELRKCLRKDTAIQVIPDAGHFWYVDNPRAGVEAILRFVKQQATR